MSDFLQRIAERTSGLVPVAQPVIAPMFAPEPMTTDAAPTLLEIDEVIESPTSPAPRRQVIQRVVTRSPSPAARAAEQLAPQPVQPPRNIPAERSDRAARSPHVYEIPRSMDAGAMPVRALLDDVVVAPIPEVPPPAIQPKPLPNTIGVTEPAEESQPVSPRQHTLPPFPAYETTLPASHIGFEESRPIANNQKESAPASARMVDSHPPVVVERSSAMFRREVVFSPAPEQLPAASQPAQGLVAPQVNRGQRSAPSIEALSEGQERHEKAPVQQQRGMASVEEARRSESGEFPSPRPYLATFQAQAQQNLLVPQAQPGDPPRAPLAYHDALAQEQSQHSQRSPQGTELRDSTPGVQQVTPTIRVTIGRVDVRAISAPPPPQRPRSSRSAPALSLEQYARQNRERR